MRRERERERERDGMRGTGIAGIDGGGEEAHEVVDDVERLWGSRGRFERETVLYIPFIRDISGRVRSLTL